jgi:hypothetical protein
VNGASITSFVGAQAQQKSMHAMHGFGKSGVGVHGHNQGSPLRKHALAQTAGELIAKTSGLSQAVHKS